MKKYALIVVAVLLFAACATQKSPYKSVDQRDVPERYIKDFTKKYADIDLKDVKWEMADTVTYFANFNTVDNTCLVKFTRTGTETFYVIPKEYIPSDITDYIKENYSGYSIGNVYITDSKNQKNYQVEINKKGDSKKLQFDLRGNFNKVVE
ncbi:MAG: hypothetical protein HUK18_05160 [Bacteroidales bacterium]|nr:hypothetical protein [Bacteroidales bacterium]